MTAQHQQSAGPAAPAGSPGTAPDQGEAAADETKKGSTEEPEPTQDAWAARRDLVDHSPRTMNVSGGSVEFGGSFGGGDTNIAHGAAVTGDVIMGSKTVHNYSFSGFSATTASGEVPRTTLDRLAESFVADDTEFDALLARLRHERVLVLSGARFTGRRTAALMLLRRIGATFVHALDRDTAPTALADRITDADDDTAGPRGYVLCDLVTRRPSPLREPQLLAVRDRLTEQNAYLVVTVGPTAVMEDVHPADWQPPAAEDVLTAHLRARTDEATTARLLGLRDVKEFLGRSHQLREMAAFAQVLVRYAAKKATETEVAEFSLGSLEIQVQEWFEADENAVHLRDKAFLVALAAFDGGPYALTAELGDLLYHSLQQTQDRSLTPDVPIFGTHIGKRLQLARAKRYEDEENTEWGPVTQTKAAFLDERVSLVLLREIWTGHPSARPALIEWLRRLAEDGRPLVRTRAASTVAVLARTDLPSAMALVIEPWARSNLFRHRQVAVNSLTLAHSIGTPNIPRILDAWSNGSDRRLRWVATRAYGLIGPERPEQALTALRGAVRRLYADVSDPDDFDREMAGELAEAVELLLLSDAAPRVLAELRAHLDNGRPVRDLALGGFVNACRRTEGDEHLEIPLVLGRYARASSDDLQSAHGISHLWRVALDDRHATEHALDALRGWVLIADRSTATEWALAALLPQLVTTPVEHARLSHLLRTMPGEDDDPPPSVAARLLTTLPPR